MDVIQVDLVRLKDEFAFSRTLHLYSHSFEQRDEVVHVQNIGYILYRDAFAREQHCADYLQSLVFGSLGSDGA